MKKEISAVVLAGGFGSRLMPITETTPKPLVDLCGKSAFERIIELLLKNGISDIAVTTLYLAEQIERVKVEGASLRFFRERKPLGTAGSVRNAASALGQTFVVISGDVVCDFDLRKAVSEHIERGGLATVLTVRTESPTEYGTVVAKDGNIRYFDEKPSWSRTASNLINTGIYIFDREVLSYIDEGIRDFAKDLFPLLLREGRDICCAEQKGFWCDIGDLKSYYECCFKLSGNKRNIISENASVAGSASLDGVIVLGDATIEDGAVINKSIICDGVFVGKNAKIESGAVIGGKTVISEGAYIAENVILRSGLYVGKEARLMRSIIFGEARRKLLDAGRVSGRYGSDINGELCLRIGEAIASKEYPYEKGRTKIGVMHCGTAEGKVLSDALICGARLYGAECLDLEDGFEALCAFCAGEYELDCSVFVRTSGGEAEIFLYDRNCLPPTRQFERSVEAALNRYNLPSSRAGEVVSLEREERPKFRYVKRLISVAPQLDGSALFVGEKNKPSEFLFSVARENGAVADYYSEESPESSEGRTVFYISENGFSASAKLQSGEKCGFWELLCIAASAHKGKIVLPSLSPLFVEEEFKKNGAEPIFCGDLESAERESAYETIWVMDGVALCLKALEAAKKQETSLSELYSRFPHRSFESRTVAVDESLKAKKIDDLGREGVRGRNGEGIRLVYERGSVVVVPLNAGGFRLFAEAVSSEAAEEIFAETERKIKARQEDKE